MKMSEQYEDWQDVPHDDYADIHEGDEPWVREIREVAESCGYMAGRIERDDIICVAISDGTKAPSHLTEIVWNYLKEHTDAREWLRVWLDACSYATRERE